MEFKKINKFQPNSVTGWKDLIFYTEINKLNRIKYCLRYFTIS